MTNPNLPRHVGAPPPSYRVLLMDVPGPDDTRQDLTVEIAPPYFPDPAPLPAATLWATLPIEGENNHENNHER